jgi:branched-chain amino acid transport system ATP-binding protein
VADKLRLHVDEVRYGAHTVLRAVDIEVSRASIVTLLGANGSGKTSAVRAMSGMIPFTGYVEVGGERIRPLTAERVARRGILQVPEGRGLFGPMTVLENLQIGAYLRSDPAAVRRDLDWVYALFPRLRERAQQPAGFLSGGEQQMLALGKALMGDPRYLILDEPSFGLAPLVVEQVFQTIEKVKDERGIGVLLVEQNASMALAVSTHGYVLDGGTVRLSAASQALANDPEVVSAYLGG